MTLSLTDAATISMLPPATLARLALLASETSGGILEVGAYIGGASAALAIGSAGRVRHAVIEAGGAHPHPTLPSADIIADWRANMNKFGLSDGPVMFEGWAQQAEIRDAALEHTGEIGLLVIDADGDLAPIVKPLAPAMQATCRLVFDDYYSPGAPEKEALVRSWVDFHVSAGRFITDSVESGTWFGRIADREALIYLASMPIFRREQGFAYAISLRAERPIDSALCHASKMLLYEDGLLLGPAHSDHDSIRRTGCGRYSHWRSADGDWLYFSASDNSDPNINGRSYEASFDNGRRLSIERLT